MNVDEYINQLNEPLGKISISLRTIIKEVAPEFEETYKWGMITYIHGYKICAIGAYKDHVNIQFYKTHKIKDPKKLLKGNGKEARHISIKSLDEFK